MKYLWITALALAALASAPVAAHAGTCTYDSGLKKVTYQTAGSTEAFSVAAMGAAPNGGISVTADNVGLEQCPGSGGATVGNTDTIVIMGGGNMTFDLSNPLGPGATSEGGTSSEIEVDAGPVKGVTIKGSSASDHIRVGDDGINMNADESIGDIDVTMQDNGSGSSTPVEIFGRGGNDTLGNQGGAGTGAVESNPGEDAIIDGGPGNDTIEQRRPNSSVRGGAGDDGLTGDTLAGGGSSVTALYDDASSGVSVSLATGASQAVGGGLGSDTLSQIHGLVGGPSGDSLTGSNGPDSLAGRGGADTLDGNGDDDTLDPGGSEDSDNVIGDGGVDTLAYSDSSEGGPSTGVEVNLTIAGPQDTLGGGTDTIGGIENIRGTRYADGLLGDDGPNELWATGSDSVGSSAESDFLYGGGGADHLNTEQGLDYSVMDGGEGDDDLLGGVAEELLLGWDGDDTLDSGDGYDILDGELGEDTLDAGADDDDVYSDDGEFDHVKCGTGVDFAFWDEPLDDVDADCEPGSFDDPDDDIPGPPLPKPPVPKPIVTPPATLANFQAKDAIHVSAKRRGRCVSSSKAKIKVNNPPGVNILQVVVKVNGKKVKDLVGAGWESGFSVKLKKKKSTVTVLATDAAHRTVSTTRTYRRCKK